ncbi:MAG TPA: hypothetical protein VFA70_02155 [Dehalococcoidia bacterium]|jgi:hypothetical protein|nr:hypothetical protein [Dehalococcoidia bacterium]
MKITWTKNLRLRLAALLAALAATAGLYSVIQAQPLGRSSSAPPTAAPAQQPSAPAPVLPAPSYGSGFGAATNAPAYQPQSGATGRGFAPHVRTRAS